MKTVHILDAGFPLCMFSTTVPGNWPKGNVWIDMVLFKRGSWEEMVAARLGPCKICSRCKEIGDECDDDAYARYTTKKPRA